MSFRKRSYLPIAVLVTVILFCAGCNGSDIIIHNPDESLFFVPSDDEPMKVLLSLPDTWTEGSPVWSIALLDDAGGTILNQGYVPMNGRVVTVNPGAIQAQERSLEIPAATSPGWHTLRAVALRGSEGEDPEIVMGESERFWISHVGFDGNAGLDVFIDAAMLYRPGDPVLMTLFPYDEISDSYDCSAPATDLDVMLFKGGSHGPSHRHWTLDGAYGGSITVTVTLPADVTPGSDYFFHIDKGPTCNGTSDYFQIVAS